EKEFLAQKVSAWGEMQSLEEEPAYKESDIKDEQERAFFCGYKYAVDELVSLIKDDTSEWTKEDIKEIMIGNICMNLFSILDQQGED
ncbi:MAG: hypothetical protein MJ135_06990, partial [Oscillospiraceae bacterium]|nr:hypothetical protein [Oscillospiraceae bacterium]